MLSATPFTTVDSSLTSRQQIEQLLLADPSCQTIQAMQREALCAAVDIGSDDDPLAWITQDLWRRQQGGSPVGFVHVLAHGRPGAFPIADQWVDAEALKAHANG